jgi:ADP-heptose:LPS heptosyltransferase
LTGRSLHVLRVGHMGDVLLTEPIAAALRADFQNVVLYTDYMEAGRLMPVYDEVRPFLAESQVITRPGDRVLKLVYEVYPGINHLDGFARCAGVTVPHRVPILRRGSRRLVREPYVLLAPDTSPWIERMRRWPSERLLAVGELIRTSMEMRVLVLNESHSFGDMISLIEHCGALLGNDSGPAILAQCFERPTFVIFGATSPERVLLADSARAIVHPVGCNGCKHFARHTDIECATPLCLDQLSVESVFEAFSLSFAAESPAQSAYVMSAGRDGSPVRSATS